MKEQIDPAKAILPEFPNDLTNRLSVIVLRALKKIYRGRVSRECVRPMEGPTSHPIFCGGHLRGDVDEFRQEGNERPRGKNQARVYLLPNRKKKEKSEHGLLDDYSLTG